MAVARMGILTAIATAILMSIRIPTPVATRMAALLIMITIKK